jgi:hypothetical protein
MTFTRLSITLGLPTQSNCSMCANHHATRVNPPRWPRVCEVPDS